MDSCKKAESNLGVPMTLLCVNRAHGTWNLHFQASPKHDSMCDKNMYEGKKSKSEFT